MFVSNRSWVRFLERPHSIKQPVLAPPSLARRKRDQVRAAVAHFGKEQIRTPLVGVYRPHRDRSGIRPEVGDSREECIVSNPPTLRSER